MKRIIDGPAVIAWVGARTASRYHEAVGIGIEQDGRIIAGVVFDGYNGANINMHCAAEPGARWLTREFLWFVFQYPFDQLRVTRITSPVGAGNTAARRFIEHIGFHIEARLKDAHQSGDLLLYVMRRDDCRWLALRRSSAHDNGQQELKAA